MVETDDDTRKNQRAGRPSGNMAARARLSLQSLLRRNVHFWRTKRSLHAEAAVKQPSYPAVVPSLTAKSKSSLRYRYELRLEDIKASAVEEKIRLLTRIQRKKYVVFPQTLSRKADQWHQHFTKTAYIPGLPDVYSAVEQPPEDSPPAVGLTALPVIGEDTFGEIRSLVSHAVLQEQWYMKKREPFLYRRQEHFVEPFMRNLVAGVTGCLAQHNPLLLLASKGTPRSMVTCCAVCVLLCCLLSSYSIL